MENGFNPCSASAEHGRIYIIVKVMDFTLNSKQMQSSRNKPTKSSPSFYSSSYILNSIFLTPVTMKSSNKKGSFNFYLNYHVAEASGNSSVDELVS